MLDLLTSNYMKYFIIIILCTFSISASAQYSGGDGDGTMSIFLDFDTDFYHGGDSDGYVYADISGSSSIYYGNEGDGHSSMFLDISENIYVGSDSDGYDMLQIYRTYIWSGDIGTGWNVSGNWIGTAIPRLRHNVIIPNGRPNYPNLNSGIFATRKILSSANYFCKNIQIANSAELTFKVNNFVENHGKIHSYGTIYSLNLSANAIQNLVGGEIRLFSGSQLLID